MFADPYAVYRERTIGTVFGFSDPVRPTDCASPAALSAVRCMRSLGAAGALGSGSPNRPRMGRGQSLLGQIYP